MLENTGTIAFNRNKLKSIDSILEMFLNDEVKAECHVLQKQEQYEAK